MQNNNETYHYKDGSIFTGQLINGKENGFGTLINSKGDKYEGEFIDGLKCGNGTLHYHNGDIYVGEFRNDLKNGKGTYTGDILKDRIVYESEVKVKQYVGGFYDDLEWGYGGGYGVKTTFGLRVAILKFLVEST